MFPKEFVHLCISFFPHSHEQYASQDEWIAGTVHGFLIEDGKKVVRAFLDELLSGRYSDAQIERAWLDTNPTWRFDPASTRRFLTKIRRALG